MEEGGFTLVTRASKGRGRCAPSARGLARAVALVEAPPVALAERDVAKLAADVLECSHAVRESQTWALVCRALDELGVHPERIVCYGLGSPSISRIARNQLGLLLLLVRRMEEREAELLLLPPSPPPRGCAPATEDGLDATGVASAVRGIRTTVHDPILTDADRAILRAVGLSAPSAPTAPLGAGAGSPHAVGGARTLFYMPHCDQALYECVLAANWHGGLHMLWVLGNSFAAYHERVVGRSHALPTPRLDAVAARTRELSIADRFAVPGVFNNLSLHAFAAAAEPQPAVGDAPGCENTSVTRRPVSLASEPRSKLASDDRPGGSDVRTTPCP